mgnify:CR=1 FL=1
MNNKIRLIVDISMFILTFLLMNVNFISPLWHEIFGITISFLIIIHLILNFKWIKNITKNIKKVKSQTKILYAVDILTFFSYFITITLGILISTSIFNFKTSYNPYLMLIHHITGRLSLSLMLVHFGFHLNRINPKFTKNETIKGIIYIIYITIGILITMYLIYTLVRSYVWQGVMLG